MTIRVKHGGKITSLNINKYSSLILFIQLSVHPSKEGGKGEGDRRKE